MRYLLTWNGDGVTDVDGGKQVVNDRGYTIRLQRGYLVNRSVELVECPRTARLADWLLPPAWAGHSVGTPNPAAILRGRVESLIDAGTIEMGRVVLQPMRYCRVFYLIARADAGCAGMPTGVDLFDQSLYLEGTYRAASTAEDRPFVLRSPIANGKESALYPPGRQDDPAAEIVFDSGRAGGEVRVRRRLAGMFDGVDFAEPDQRRIGRQILANLINQTEIDLVADERR